MRKHIVAFVLVLVMVFGTLCTYAADPAVVVVNPVPNSTISTTVDTNSVLISVKILEPKTIKMSVSKVVEQENAENTYTLLQEYEAFTTYNDLTFYSQQLNDIEQGVYKITIQTLTSAEEVAYTTDRFFVVSEKSSEVTFTTSTALQNLLKMVFGN